jgi:hypothetical protein
MYAHSFLVTSVRGIALDPITAARAALGVTGFMKAAFGFRAGAFFFFAVLAIGVLSRRKEIWWST